MTRKWGTAYEWVYRFLIERDGSVCYLCSSESDEKGSKNLWIEHIDNNPNNSNPLNLRLAHPSCNEKKNPPRQNPQPVPLSVRVASDEAAAGARILAKSEQMLPLYRRAMYDPKEGVMRNPGQIYPKKWLANMMQEEWIRVGTATTYLKYIGADISAGYLDEKEMLLEADDMRKAHMETVVERTLKPYPEEKLR